LYWRSIISFSVLILVESIVLLDECMDEETVQKMTCLMVIVRIKISDATGCRGEVPSYILKERMGVLNSILRIFCI
jgi:hypothetical protein